MLQPTLESICEGSIVACAQLLFGVGKIESQVLHVAPRFSGGVAALSSFITKLSTQRRK